MEPSKLPKDVLGLGRHLVRELGFEDGVDTLGRWMAHHLAELINEAENGATKAARLKAYKTATETILKIWEHRASLPGKAYPLAPYKDVLKVLDVLRLDANPFWHFSRSVEKREQMAAALFDRFSRLVIALLLRNIPSGERAAEVDTAAKEALSETEQHVLTALQRWSEIFESKSKDPGQAQKSEGGDGSEVNLDEIAIQLIDRMTTTLAELRSELQEVAQQPAQRAAEKVRS